MCVTTYEPFKFPQGGSGCSGRSKLLASFWPTRYQATFVICECPDGSKPGGGTTDAIAVLRCITFFNKCSGGIKFNTFTWIGVAIAYRKAAESWVAEGWSNVPEKGSLQVCYAPWAQAAGEVALYFDFNGDAARDSDFQPRHTIAWPSGGMAPRAMCVTTNRDPFVFPQDGSTCSGRSKTFSAVNGLVNFWLARYQPTFVIGECPDGSKPGGGATDAAATYSSQARERCITFVNKCGDGKGIDASIDAAVAYRKDARTWVTKGWWAIPEHGKQRVCYTPWAQAADEVALYLDYNHDTAKDPDFQPRNAGAWPSGGRAPREMCRL